MKAIRKGNVPAMPLDLLKTLRRATHWLADGTKAQKPSVIGRTLSDSQLLIVWQRLGCAKSAGIVAYDELAGKIQGEWGLCADMSRWHLARAVQYYESRVFGLLGAVEADHDMAEWGKTQRGIAKKVAGHIDALEKLREAATIQEGRIAQMVKSEQSSGKLHPQGHKEMDAYMRTLSSLLGHEMALGLRDRKPAELDVTIRRGFEQHADSTGVEVLSASAKLLAMLRDGKFETVEDGGMENANDV